MRPLIAVVLLAPIAACGSSSARHPGTARAGLDQMNAALVRGDAAGVVRASPTLEELRAVLHCSVEDDAVTVQLDAMDKALGTETGAAALRQVRLEVGAVGDAGVKAYAVGDDFRDCKVIAPFEVETFDQRSSVTLGDHHSEATEDIQVIHLAGGWSVLPRIDAGS